MNLINELQASAETDDVLTVLRRTKRLASKLGRDDISDWLQSEQHGYAGVQIVPDYRKIGSTLALNTNGYVPAGYGMVMQGIREIPSFPTFPIPITDPISTVISWIEASKDGHGIYNPIEEGTDLSRMIRSSVQLDPMFSRQVTFLLHLNDSQVKAIPEHIKDKVLDWACALEAAGVTGTGLSFSEEEKQIAHAITFNIADSHIEQLNNLGSNEKSAK